MNVFRGPDAPNEAISRLRHRLTEAYRAPEAPRPDDLLVVGVSGGVDSCVLLHALVFGVPNRAGAGRLVAAHLDHRMRPDSHADARWLRGLAAAWGVEYVSVEASASLSSEADAREARYAFLEDVRRRVGGATVVTAHHADDQAETVLFRLFRGTGPAGLRGIRRGGGAGAPWRPLLQVWRSEIVQYAQAVGLRWREDPTNRRLAFARNALRHRILPEAERLVSTGARRALVRFAETAARDEDGWDSLMPSLVDGLAPIRLPGGLSVDRARLADLHPAVRGRVLRTLAARLDLNLSARVTEEAVDFVVHAGSGASLDLGGGVVARSDLDRITVVMASEPPPDRPVLIARPGSGSAHGVLGGRRVRVAWGDGAAHGEGFLEHFLGPALRFPLLLRGWEPGDRIRLPTGSKKVKQVFLEARIPAPERRKAPVLIDDEGSVLWIPGVARAVGGDVHELEPEGLASRTLAIRVR